MKRCHISSTLGAAVVLAAMTGCSIGESEDPPLPEATPAGAGSVAGTFRVSGGPSPGVDEPVSGTVTSKGRGTEEVAQSDGTFAIELPPGTYTVTGHPQKGRLAPTTCTSEAVTVVAEQVTTVEVSCVLE